jgi:hypothetical protein
MRSTPYVARNAMNPIVPFRTDGEGERDERFMTGSSRRAVGRLFPLSGAASVLAATICAFSSPGPVGGALPKKVSV